MPIRDLPSRNRHFALYESAEGRTLLRSKRLLASVESDLLSFGRVHGFRIRKDARSGRYCVSVNLEAAPVRYRRTSYLTEKELLYLKENPALKDLLEAGAWSM